MIGFGCFCYWCWYFHWVVVSCYYCCYSYLFDLSYSYSCCFYWGGFIVIVVVLIRVAVSCYCCCFCIGLFFNSDLRRTCIWRLRTSTRRSKKLWTLCRRACLSFFFFVIIGVIMYWVVIFIVVIVDILSWFVSFIGLLSTDTIVVICIGLLCINIIHVILYCDVPSYYYRFSFEWVVLYYNYCWYI